MKIVYPFVGGTETTHKFNLKDPQDTDAAFRLSFTGTWVHDGNGAAGDGSAAYALTHVTATGTFSVTNSHHITEFIMTDNLSSGWDIGVRDTSNEAKFGITSGFYDGPTYAYPMNSTLSNSVTDTLGFYALSTIPGTTGGTATFSKNGTELQSLWWDIDNLIGTGDRNTYELLLGAVTLDGSVAWHSNRKFGFLSLGDGLTNAEVETLRGLVDTYETELGRNPL